MSTQTNIEAVKIEAITAQIDLKKATLTALNKQRNAMLDALHISQFAHKVEAISKIINAQIAKLKELNKQRNELLHEMYKSHFAHNVEVLEYFELFEVLHERKATIYFNDKRILLEFFYDKNFGYSTQTALYYIVKMYNAKMIAHTEISTLYTI